MKTDKIVHYEYADSLKMRSAGRRSLTGLEESKVVLGAGAGK